MNGRPTYISNDITTCLPRYNVTTVRPTLWCPDKDGQIFCVNGFAVNEMCGIGVACSPSAESCGD